MSNEFVWVIVIDTGGNDMSYVAVHKTEEGANDQAANLNKNLKEFRKGTVSERIDLGFVVRKCILLW